MKDIDLKRVDTQVVQKDVVIVMSIFFVKKLDVHVVALNFELKEKVRYDNSIIRLLLS